MTTNERFLSVLHRVTSCRHLATVNITIWNGCIEVRHTVFDEMYILRSFPLPNTQQQHERNEPITKNLFFLHSLNK